MKVPVSLAIDSLRTQTESTSLRNKNSFNKNDPFLEMLKSGFQEVNESFKHADQKSLNLVSGKSTNLHETMLAVAKAEIGLNALVQIRNKAIEAYQEVMRMQV